MGFFSKKVKISLVDFCYKFYEETFINPTIGGENFAEVFPKSLLKQLVEVNEKFEKVDFFDFSNEILKIRFELFGLAFYYRFGERDSINCSIFTKIYLEQKNIVAVWNGAEDYNKQIAEGATFGLRNKGDVGAMKILEITKARMDSFNKYFEIFDDAQCVARSVNRFWTYNAWKINYIQYCLALSLSATLKIESSENTELMLASIFTGIFNGAFEAMENIKIVD